MTIPTPAQIIDETRAFLLVVREALEHGIRQARQFFDDEGELPDAWLAPDLVRWHAKRFLDSGGHLAQSLEEDYGRTPASNNGLRLTFKRFLVMVRKSDDGELPVPASQVQRDLYSRNQAVFEFIPRTSSVDGQEITLAILWDADREYQNLISLILTLPRIGGETRETTKAYWSEPVMDIDGSAEGQDDLENYQRREDEAFGGSE